MSPPIATPATTKSNDDDDLFAAFKAETKVDNASHYPPPAPKSPALDLTSPSAWQQPASTGGGGFGNDDDPFGLNQLKPKSTGAPIPASNHEDDDLLGDLGRPVDEVRRKQPPAAPAPAAVSPRPMADEDSSSDDEGPAPTVPRSNNAVDQAVAQLVEYGFSAEDARRGLRESGAGVNVQAAANWLLDDAHKKAKEKARGGQSQSQSRDRGRTRPQADDDAPAWMRNDRSVSSQRRPESAASSEGDFAKQAAAMGNSLFKTANSLWKSGQKKVQKAVAELQQPEGDSGQPKWMRDAQLHERSGGKPNNMTNEAMLLESGGRPERPERPERSERNERHERHERPERPTRPTPDTRSRDQSPALSAPSSGRSTPKWQQSGPALMDSRSRLSRLASEDDNLSAYVSPNRRKTPQPEQSRPPPETKPRPKPDADLDLFGAPSPASSIPHRPSPSPQPAKRPAAPPRPAPPRRQVPQLDPSALQASNRNRLAGTAHFKRGDYATAHESYTSSMHGIPETHPLIIVLLTNRALTHLKTGSPKQAVDDADTALKVIGPSGGVGESVMVAGESGAEEKRDMRDLYGKALSRKAEALEQMERWSDASAVWQLCVEGGVGGAIAIQGRQRCQNALAPKPKPKPKPVARPKPSAISDLGGQKSSEAVEKLRQANEAAAKEDDEKFALADQVDARIAAWRDGKTENLRALLGSLDQVLWEGSGWNKVSLADLVMANKVKIVYMKAIAKTHPDKLPQDASTEVKLVAAIVFSTLNESWDKFKADNKL